MEFLWAVVLLFHHLKVQLYHILVNGILLVSHSLREAQCLIIKVVLLKLQWQAGSIFTHKESKISRESKRCTLVLLQCIMYIQRLVMHMDNRSHRIATILIKLPYFQGNYIQEPIMQSKFFSLSFFNKLIYVLLMIILSYVFKLF